MKRYFLGFFAFSLLTLIWSCTNTSDPKAQQDRLEDKIMGIHDEVMPKMGEFNQTKQQLMQVLFLAKLDQKTREDLSAVVGNMGETEEAMMTWMNERQSAQMLRGEKKDHAFIMDYLAKDQAKIEKIGKDMDDLSAKAKKAIAEYPVKAPGGATPPVQ